MKHLLLALTTALILLACAPKTAPVPVVPNEVQSQIDKDARTAEECRKSGGNLGRGGMMPDLICYHNYSDAGKVCDDKSDCLGRCISDNNSLPPNSNATGTCQPTEPFFGCFTEINGGKTQGTLCVD